MTTCKNCGQPIVLKSTYWTHRDTDRVACSPGSEQCAQPRSGLAEKSQYDGTDE
jgi:hypothetical protein